MANAWIIKPLPIRTVTATSTATGDPNNLGQDYAGIVWASGPSNEESIIIDLGGNRVVDTILLFGVTAPSAATITAQGATSAQGNGFASPTYVTAPGSIFAGTVRLTSGMGVSIVAPTGWAAIRYLKLIFSMPTAGTVQLSRAVVNKRIVLERNFGFGGNLGVRDLGSLDFSARGVLLRRRAAKLRTIALTFSNVRKDEVESTVKPLLEQIGNTEMVALVTDPSANAQLENRSYFGPLVGDLGVMQRNSAGWETKVNMVSMF